MPAGDGCWIADSEEAEIGCVEPISGDKATSEEAAAKATKELLSIHNGRLIRQRDEFLANYASCSVGTDFEV